MSSSSSSLASEAPSGRWAIALHGGAGVIPKTDDRAVFQPYLDGLEAALQAGVDILARGGSALDASEATVRSLEDNELFNAGRGAVLDADGRAAMDAAIMCGATLRCGAVAVAHTARNPIAAARAVMEQTPHVLLAGDGADAFVAAAGLPQEARAYFVTERRRLQLQRAKAEQRVVLDHSSGAFEGGDASGTAAAAKAPEESIHDGRGTVGCVALDASGRLSAATSTGGLCNKMPGRTGDTPLIGAGTYADARCAVSGTGTGEQFIRHVVAHTVAAAIRFGGQSLHDACHTAVFDQLDPDDGGVIAVGRDGAIAMVFNSEGMFRAAADSQGRREVAIWEATEAAAAAAASTATAPAATPST